MSSRSRPSVALSSSRTGGTRGRRRQAEDGGKAQEITLSPRTLNEWLNVFPSRRTTTPRNLSRSWAGQRALRPEAAGVDLVFRSGWPRSCPRWATGSAFAILTLTARIAKGSPEAAIAVPVMSARMIPGFFLASVGGVLVDRRTGAGYGHLRHRSGVCPGHASVRRHRRGTLPGVARPGGPDPAVVPGQGGVGSQPGQDGERRRRPTRSHSSPCTARSRSPPHFSRR